MFIIMITFVFRRNLEKTNTTPAETNTWNKHEIAVMGYATILKWQTDENSRQKKKRAHICTNRSVMCLHLISRVYAAFPLSPTSFISCRYSFPLITSSRMRNKTIQRKQPDLDVNYNKQQCLVPSVGTDKQGSTILFYHLAAFQAKICIGGWWGLFFK